MGLTRTGNKNGTRDVKEAKGADTEKKGVIGHIADGYHSRKKSAEAENTAVFHPPGGAKRDDAMSNATVETRKKKERSARSYGTWQY